MIVPSKAAPRWDASRGLAIVGGRLVLAATLLVLASLSALAHGGELELTVNPADIAAGEEVTVSGEGFAASAPLELHLTGPNGDAHFDDATTDQEGAFTQVVQIPGDVVPGVYLLRAEGAEQEASAELTVGAMAGMTAPASEAAAERGRPVVWQTVAAVLFLALGIAGLALARPTRGAVPQPS